MLDNILVSASTVAEAPLSWNLSQKWTYEINEKVRFWPNSESVFDLKGRRAVGYLGPLGVDFIF